MRAARPVHESHVHLVGAVLIALKPVARHLFDVPAMNEAGLARGRERREGRRLALAKISEHQTQVLARRITRRSYLAREARIFGRHLDALPAAIEFPAVVEAAHGVALHPAEMKLGAAVRAAVIEDVRAAALAAVQRVVLAHDADRLRVPGREIFAAMDGEPELAHEAPAGRARPRRGDV